MALWSNFGLGNGMAAAAAAASLVVAGVVGFQFLRGADDAPAPAVSAPVEAPADIAAPPGEPAPEAAPVSSEAEPERAASDPDSEPATAPTAAAAPVAPRFDLVRVDAAGGAVIAGRAAANADLRLRLDGQEIYTASSDGTGAFVAMLSIPPSELPQVLSLEMVIAGGEVVISDQSVIIQPATAVAAAAPAADASPDLPVIDTDLPALASAADPTPEADLPTAPQATLPDSPVPVAGADAGAGETVATAAPATPETTEPEATVTELALLEAEAPEAELPESAAAEPAGDTAPVSPAPIADDAPDGTEASPAVSESDAAPSDTAGPEVAAITEPAPAPEPQPSSTPDVTETASIATTPEPSVAPDAAPADGSPQQPDAVAPPSTAPAAEAQAPTVMIADSQGIRVVQSGGPEPQVQVVLDSIAYDTEGEVVLRGRGPAQSDVRLYLDNQPVQLARIDTAGGWSTQLPQVDPGTYTLRVDEVDQAGAVLSRVETPFLREEPAVLEALPQRDGVSVITVQPGHTLWGIARDQLGAGVLYVQVYEANRDQIRDPHWIYPGQIFAIPDIEPDG